MSGYLLDTNICAYFLNGQFKLAAKFEAVGIQNCAISQITIAELKYGIAKSTHKEKNRNALEVFISRFVVFPILPVLDIYAAEKARLKRKGKSLDDFDLLIGATAIFNNLVLATRNVSDFERMEGIVIENWID